MRASNRQERVAVLRLAPWIAAAVAAGSAGSMDRGGEETASAIEMFPDPQAPEPQCVQWRFESHEWEICSFQQQRGSSSMGGFRGGGGGGEVAAGEAAAGEGGKTHMTKEKHMRSKTWMHITA